MPRNPKPRAVRPPRSLGERLNTAVVHLNRQLRRADIAVGLPTAQASALALLVSAGPHTNSELAGFELVSGPTMTRIVSALEDRGLVSRGRSPGDQRSVRIEATAAGRELIARALANRVTELDRRLATLPPQSRSALESAVDILGELARHRN